MSGYKIQSIFVSCKAKIDWIFNFGYIKFILQKNNKTYG